MLSLIRSLVNAGADLDAHRRRYVVNTNVFALIAVAITLPYPFIYLYLKVDIDALLLSGAFVFVLAYLGVVLLNYLKLHIFAKFLIFATALTQVFAICITFGRVTGLDQFFYALFVGVFFTVDRHQKIMIIPALAVIVGEYLLVEYIQAYTDPLVKLSPQAAKIIYYTTTASVFSLLGMQCLYFYWGNQKGELELENAQETSEKLLLNILPKTIADELKKYGAVAPVEHDSVTVVFTDFVGFTQSSEARSPADLLRELDDCFSEFDNIIEKHRLEKLKTIGDAYMFAGGVPTNLKDNAIQCVLAAKEIIDFVERRRNANPRFWQIRVGVHTGRLVAGVIGRKKFIYDVWGDTVNTASRLEAAGEPGRINTSAETYALIKDRFSGEYRGEIVVKGKGPLPMYFVG